MFSHACTHMHGVAAWALCMSVHRCGLSAITFAYDIFRTQLSYCTQKVTVQCLTWRKVVVLMRSGRSARVEEMISAAAASLPAFAASKNLQVHTARHMCCSPIHTVVDELVCVYVCVHAGDGGVS